jgi:hypothetical protein
MEALWTEEEFWRVEEDSVSAPVREKDSLQALSRRIGRNPMKDVV